MGIKKIIGLKCVKCGKEFGEDEVLYTCSLCGTEGILDVLYDYDYIKSGFSIKDLSKSLEWSMWRYRPLLPVSDTDIVPPLQVGWTPLYAAKRLGNELGVPGLFIKDDSRNPTASLKDRASAVGVTRAGSAKYETIVAASTGNAASSVSGIAASAGIKTIIFVPERAPKPKVAQLLVFGSTVIMVKGSYDQAFDLSIQASDRWGWYNRNCAYNPYLVEGKKTMIMEVLEQLKFNPPNKVFISMGDGCITSSIWKGIKDFRNMGFIKDIPEIIGVQAEGACPLKTAWETNSPVKPVEADTLADSIAVGCPRNALKALNAIKSTGGQIISVSDNEILEAMKTLARKSGIFAEPAGAAPFAGFVKMVNKGKISRQEKVVVVVTGSGLKDVKSAIKAVGKPILVEPDMNKVIEKVETLILK